MKKIALLSTIIFTSLSNFAQCPDYNHPHFIDLGLPSGKGWACCNVCATSPEDFGGFFAYGEYTEKNSYSKENYLYYENLGYGYSIWNNIGTRTDISGSAGYDVAYKVMGEDWRMPNKKECEELVDSCTWEWTSMNGVTGYQVTGPNGNYIFLPAAGFKSSFNHNKIGERGIYRSSMWTMINGEASTSYAIDFNENEVQVNSLGYRANGLTVRPISAASMNCYVNYSFIEEQKDKEARGFTADGKSEIAITYKAKNTILDENIDLKFYLDDQEVDETIAGKVTDIKYLRDSIAIILTAPKDFLISQGVDYKIKIDVTPYRGGKPLNKVGYKYRVLRPGVLFIHGLGDKDECFFDMIDYLVNQKLYIKCKNKQGNNEDYAKSPQLFSVDYRESNTSSFMTNTTEKAVVKGGCETICRNLFESDSIVSAKYDMVGHSMGGILARLYVQETENGKESTNKIITLNTPHYGSEWGNVYQAIRLFEMIQNPLSICFKNFSTINYVLTHTLYQSDNSLDAINDLSFDSKAINDLNGPNSAKLAGISVHSICSYFEKEQEDNSICEPSYGVELRIGLIDRLIRKKPQKGVSLLSNVFGDGVVPLYSQQGGLSGYNTSILRGSFKEAMHMFTPHWISYLSETANLLKDYVDGTSFSLNGFPAYNSQNARRNTTDNENEYLETFEEPQDGSFITANITSATAADYTHICKVSHSDDMLTYEVFAIPTEETIIYGIDENEMKLDLSNVESDSIKFYIVGRTNYDALLLDSVVVHLNSDITIIKSMHNNNDKIRTSYSNDAIIISLPTAHDNFNWQLYSLDGSLVCNGQSKKGQIIFNRKRPGIYILKVTKNSITYTYKIPLK